MPHFVCDLADPPRPFPHFWEHTVGSGHAPLALRADWQRQILRCHHELGFQRVRFHGLLSTPMDTLLCQNNRLLYSFFNMDQAFDYIVSSGMHPFVELSFMPETLASGHKHVFHYQSNITPPHDYRAWSTLVAKLARHWLARYGAEEIKNWRIEVWNEPNLKSFWTGSRDEYFQLYRCAVEAIKGVDAAFQVGGPVTAANAWITEFIEFCDENNVPADFVSTHHYPTDSFGEPGDDTVTQLSKSRRSVLREEAQDAHQRAAGRPLYYTEWSSSSNPRDTLHDQPYAAAFLAKTVMEARGLVDCYSWWAFSDIFQENYMPSQPFQGGFGLLTLRDVAKPAYRAFQLLHELGDQILMVDGVHETVDAWATQQEYSVTVLLTNFALPRHEIETETTHLELPHAPPVQAVTVRRVDETHANPRRLWQALGEPTYPTAREMEQLHAAAALQPEPLTWNYEDQTLRFALELPPQAVAAVHIVFRRERPTGDDTAGAPACA